MSHFAVMVIGDGVDGKMAPYDENGESFMEFNDIEDEYREKFKTGTRDEFFCGSNSTKGMCINRYTFARLKAAATGSSLVMKVKQPDPPFSFFKKGRKYKCHCYSPHDESQEGIVWISVLDVLSTMQPDVCVRGEMLVEKIEPPKKVSFKEHYKDFDTFMEGYGGYKKGPDGKYGYYANPNAKWDWYEVGGRWKGLLVLNGSHERVNQAKFGDIDWEATNNDEEEARKLKRFWEIVVEGQKPVDEKERKSNFSVYNAEFYVERYKTKEQFIALSQILTTYAVVSQDGEWHSPGEMGWWGFSSESDEDNILWKKNFFDEFLKDLKPDTLITIVDCHI